MPEHDYIPLNERLWLKFETEDMDILHIGVLNYHLHTVLNQVAITMFQVHDETLRDGGSRERALPFIPQTYNREDTLIRARVSKIRQGSLEMELSAFAAAIFSQPGAVAVVHNLFSNVIWAIGHYAAKVSGVYVRRIRGADNSGALLRPQAARKRLRPKIEKFIHLLSESSNGGRLHFRSEDEEIEIEFYRGEE